MKVEAHTQVDRSVADAFAWYAADHVRNHPRWDPDIELEHTSDEPIGVGTIIRRRNTRYGTPVEGTIEVLSYVPDQAIRFMIREGGFEMPGWATFESLGPHRTLLTVGGDFPDHVDEDMVAPLMARSVQTIKELLESDT